MRKYSLSFCACLILLASCVQAQESERVLFNGKNLDGWAGNAKLWSVEDGAITGRTTDEDPIEFNTFLIWKGGELADFELTLRYRMFDGNSGIQYRSRVVDEEKFIVGGYQADIDSSLKYAGINYEERGRGILAERGQRVTVVTKKDKKIEQFGDAEKLGKVIRAEKWNDYRVVAHGNRLQHYINGELMSEVIDEQSDKAATSGVLAFQLHRGPAMTVQFKDIRLKTRD